jgi:tRNA threonylcarbamoyladenosine biosynthesis protein TsaB
MLLLSIDTCGPLGTVALARFESEDLCIVGDAQLADKTYSAQLVPSIRDLLAAHRAALGQLGTIVVTSGPGSFTGIRIGLSTAKGLAEPNSIPVLAASRLAVLAHKAGTPAAALDAGRGEFYCVDDSGTASESLLTCDAFQQRATVLSNQLAVCEPSVHSHAPSATLVAPPTAADALRFVLPRLRARNFDDPLLLDGNYLRRSDAEIFSKPGAPPRPRAAARS